MSSTNIGFLTHQTTNEVRSSLLKQRPSNDVPSDNLSKSILAVYHHKHLKRRYISHGVALIIFSIPRMIKIMPAKYTPLVI